MLHPLPYTGSKRTDIKFFVDFIPKNINHIIEPFGGSGAVSLYLFSKNPKLKCHINDTDKELYNFYINMKEDYENIINEYNSLVEDLNKEKYKKIIEEYKQNSPTTNNKRKVALYLFYNKVYHYRKGLFSMIKKYKPITDNDYIIFKDWLKNTTFTNKDYKEIFEEYENSKDKFIFLDPPYLSSYNSSYADFNDSKKKDGVLIDNTKMFIDIKIFMDKNKNKIMNILNKNSIIDYIFKNQIISVYNKIYQMNKNKTQHNIICNYKI